MSWTQHAIPAATALALLLPACGPQAERMDDAQPGAEVAAMTGGLAADGAQEPLNQLTARERDEGWRLLFDGRTTAGWRGYNRPDMPDGWQVEDGMLVRVGRGGDIITEEQFANFELALDWRIGPGGNSGIFYRGVESSSAIYFSAPEMQILDDDAHADGSTVLTSAGSNYALHGAPRGVVRPVGEWNRVRLVVNGNHVEHWLNGRKIIEYELHSEDWKRRVAESKFRDWPAYGQAARGHIGLQDHGDRVEFRNIKVRVLP
jgi:hypothetical protein